MRIIDANLNRFKEGIRVVEDIARYILNDGDLAKHLKNIRHSAKHIDESLLIASRNIKDDVSKKSHIGEIKRTSIKDVAIANFKRAEESARVLEEILKLDLNIAPNSDKMIESSINSDTFKHLRYELYDIEIDYFSVLDEFLRK